AGRLTKIGDRKRSHLTRERCERWNLSRWGGKAVGHPPCTLEEEMELKGRRCIKLGQLDPG
ncbi:hypothetical protein AMTR_s00206p00013130, partial [Amborella trichopoda]